MQPPVKTSYLWKFLRSCCLTIALLSFAGRALSGQDVVPTDVVYANDSGDIAIFAIVSDFAEEVYQLVAMKNGRVHQTFDLSETWDYNGYATMYIDKLDINFDGYPDLEIIVDLQINTWADYHIWDSNLGKFKKIGNFGKFEIDQKSKILTSQEQWNKQGPRYEKKYTFPSNGMKIKLLSEKEIPHH